jgi:hypothetical protein
LNFNSESSDVTENRGNVIDVGLRIKGKIMRIGKALPAQLSGVFRNRDEFEGISGIGGEVFGKRRLDLCLGGGSGNLYDDFVGEVNQIDCFGILLDGVHILQLPAEQFIEKLKVKILGMEVKIKQVQFTARFNSEGKEEQFFFDVIEMKRTVHSSPVYEVCGMVKNCFCINSQAR